MQLNLYKIYMEKQFYAVINFFILKERDLFNTWAI